MLRCSHILRVSTLFMLLIAAGCGGGAAVDTDLPATGQVPNLPPVPAPQLGVSMPQLTGETFELAEYEKSASAAYRIFFRDMVNEQSQGRWGSQDLSGKKFWSLSNTCFSAPKAWLLGGNYWNAEHDELHSPFSLVEDGTDGLALTFYARWSIQAGDNGTVNYWDGVAYQQVVNFTGGSNPSYPGWDKYYFKLPANMSGNNQFCGLNIHFDSNNDGQTGFGFGIDNIAMYQTQLAAPGSLSATDGTQPGQVDLTWSYTQQGNLAEDGFDIYRADDNGGMPGSWNLLTSVAAGSTSYSDPTGNNDIYWYRVVATKVGWPDSAPSNETAGFGIGMWTTITVEDTGDDVGYWGDIALINGNPAMCYRDGTNNTIRYAYSTTPSGDNPADWIIIVVDTTGIGQPGRELSLTEVNGGPAFSYCDNASGDLVYQRAGTATGQDAGDWSAPVIISAANDCGYNSQLLVVGGTPAIAFDDFTMNALRYTHSTTAAGEAAGDWTTVDSVIDDPAAGSANGAAVSIVNGNPAAAYYYFDGMAGNLRYRRSSTASGDMAGDWSSTTTFPAFGPYRITLNTVAGNPAIAFQDSNTSNVYYYRATDSDGNNWNGVITVDSLAASYYVSLDTVNGHPALAYHHSNGGLTEDLMYVRSGTTDGSGGSWGNIETVDSTGNVGRYATMAIVDGNNPAIYYRDDTNQCVKYAVNQ